MLVIGWVVSGCVTGIAFGTLDQGSYSGYRDRAALVIRTEEEWQQVWERHTALLTPQPERSVVDFDKEVDFDTEMVLAVFLGERPTGGFAIEITAIHKRPDTLRVLVEETAPDPDAMVTQVLTQPYHVVRLPRIDLPVEFEFR